MSTSYLTTNMMLVIPVPGQQPGPDWSQNLNASLTIVDAHDHSPGSGVQITPSGINITSDLSFNNAYNLTNPRSIRLYPNIAALSDPADIGCVYEAGVDLYYNDGDGNQIRITQSGSVAGSAGTITGLPSGTASAAYVGVSGTFLFQQSTSTGANLDVASIAIRYPGSYPTPSGNYIQLQAPSALASGYSLTLPGLPGQTNVMTLGTSGTISSTTWDAVGQNMTSTGANAIRTTMTKAVISPASVGNLAAGNNSGSFSTTSTSPVAITNFNISITTSGKPVKIEIIPDMAGTASYISLNNGSGAINIRYALFDLRRNGVTVGLARLGTGTGSISAGGPQVDFAPNSVGFLDAPSAGSQNYILYVYMNNSDSVVTVQTCHLIAYELT